MLTMERQDVKLWMQFLISKGGRMKGETRWLCYTQLSDERLLSQLRSAHLRSLILL